jgi:hypothetical protein
MRVPFSPASSPAFVVGGVFDDFYFNGWGRILLWFWFAFPLWPGMVSIFFLCVLAIWTSSCEKVCPFLCAWFSQTSLRDSAFWSRILDFLDKYYKWRFVSEEAINRDRLSVKILVLKVILGWFLHTKHKWETEQEESQPEAMSRKKGIDGLEHFFFVTRSQWSESSLMTVTYSLWTSHLAWLRNARYFLYPRAVNRAKFRDYFYQESWYF